MLGHCRHDRIAVREGKGVRHHDHPRLGIFCHAGDSATDIGHRIHPNLADLHAARRNRLPTGESGR